MFSDLIYFKPNCSLCHLIFKKKVFFWIQRRVNAPEGCKVLHLNRKSAPLTEEGSGLVTRCSCCARNIIQLFHQKDLLDIDMEIQMVANGGVLLAKQEAAFEAFRAEFTKEGYVHCCLFIDSLFSLFHWHYLILSQSHHSKRTDGALENFESQAQPLSGREPTTALQTPLVYFVGKSLYSSKRPFFQY